MAKRKQASKQTPITAHALPLLKKGRRWASRSRCPAASGRAGPHVSRAGRLSDPHMNPNYLGKLVMVGMNKQF